MNFSTINSNFDRPERKFQGANWPRFYWPIRSGERIGPGVKRLGTVLYNFHSLHFFHQIHRCQHASTGITGFSYPRPFVPKNERSLWRTFVPQERKFQELSFPGPFVPGNFRSRGTKVPWNFRSQALSFSGTFVPGNESS